MATYETPQLTEVGSVRELTQQTKLAGSYDGKWYHGSHPGQNDEHGGYGS
jgi:hypothetical protein